MLATIMYGAGDVRVEQVPDAALQLPTDAVVRVVLSCICGSDLWGYGDMPASEQGRRMGHEFLGIIEAIGPDVRTHRVGDLVVAPFVVSCGACDFCREGFQTSCRNRQGWGSPDACQGEAVRVPLADGTLVKLPVSADSALLPSLLTLSDVMCTGHHAAHMGRVNERTSVTVIGDGAVGLCAVIAAKRLGAEQIILMGRHQARTDLGREFGATDVVAERGEAGIERVRELTNGDGTHVVLECVGTRDSLDMSLGAVRDAGTISRVGAPQYEEGPMGLGILFRNLTYTGGVAPARAYIEELMPDMLEGRIQPGRVFDRIVDMSGIPSGYQAMADRTALKVLIRP